MRVFIQRGKHRGLKVFLDGELVSEWHPGRKVEPKMDGRRGPRPSARRGEKTRTGFGYEQYWRMRCGPPHGYGWTNTEIARRMGISYRTLLRYVIIWAEPGLRAQREIAARMARLAAKKIWVPTYPDD